MSFRERLREGFTAGPDDETALERAEAKRARRRQRNLANVAHGGALMLRRKK